MVLEEVFFGFSLRRLQKRSLSIIKQCLRNAIELKSLRIQIGEDSYIQYGFIYTEECVTFFLDLLFFFYTCRPSYYSDILSQALPKYKNQKEQKTYQNYYLLLSVPFFDFRSIAYLFQPFNNLKIYLLKRKKIYLNYHMHQLRPYKYVIFQFNNKVAFFSYQVRILRILQSKMFKSACNRLFYYFVPFIHLI